MMKLHIRKRLPCLLPAQYLISSTFARRLFTLVIATAISACDSGSSTGPAESQSAVTDQSADLAILPTGAASVSGAGNSGIQFAETTNRSRFDRTESWGASWAYIDGDLYPDLFVGNHRAPVSIFRNNKNGTFTNIVNQADDGTFTGSQENLFTDTHGTAFADVDGDGDQDFVTLTSLARPGILMLNDGNGRFTNATERYGMAVDYEGRTPQWLDYDNDGALDLLMTSGTVSLFRNPGSLPWQEVSVPTGLRGICQRDQWFTLSDIDKNSDNGMEFLCGREGDWPGATLNYNAASGSFQHSNYLASPALSHGIDSVSADFDGDQDFDIFVTRGAVMPSQAKLINPKRLESWVWAGTNNGLRTVTFSATGRLDVEIHSNQTGQASLIQIGANGDNPDNDGGDINKTRFTLDSGNPQHRGLYYIDTIRPEDRDAWLKTPAAKRTFIGHDGNGNWTFTASPGDVATRVLITVDALDGNITNLPNTYSGVIGSVRQDDPIYPGLLINTGSGFTPNTYSARVTPAREQSCVSVVAGDFDNDMDMDVYMVCRRGVENITNVLLENDGSGNFREVSGHGAEGGIGAGTRSGWAQGENVVIADYDLDGKLDLFVTNGIVMQPLREGGQDQLFRNTSNNNNSWTQILLRGTRSNIEGIGAQVTVTANGIQQLREQSDGIHRWSQNLKRLHFGLGSATTFDIEISWPSGQVDRFSEMLANEFYDFVEGGNRPLPLDRPGSNPANSLASVVGQSVDDAIQINADNSMDLSGESIVMTDAARYQAGMVFRNINIPPQANITRAYIQFKAATGNSSNTSLLLEGHATHYTGIFKPNIDDIGFRARTDASIAWNNIEPWTEGQTYRSPDVSSIVQEIISGPRWESGNAMAILVSDNGSAGGTRNAVSYDGSASEAPRLIVQWR